MLRYNSGANTECSRLVPRLFRCLAAALEPKIAGNGITPFLREAGAGGSNSPRPQPMISTGLLAFRRESFWGKAGVAPQINEHERLPS
jgi:hypothetical protein